MAQTNLPKQKVRCGTMQALEIYLKSHPQKKGALEYKTERAGNVQNTTATKTTDALLTIPVVVHLVLSAADMALVTDADVLWQINKLNTDFSGLNADSVNGSTFYATRAHSNIRFCLAQQDAVGNPTNGIDRVISSITDFTTDNVGRLKYAATCGANAWNTEKYFNIWVSRSSSIVGIATFAGAAPASEQGIAISLDGFSNNPAFVAPAYSGGRTVVHETGHYLGLYHNWGDDDGCNLSDFRQLPGDCIILGSDIVGDVYDVTVGDTPNQGSATIGCPNGIKKDGCSPDSVGVQYQNYMDYTDDNCYSLFTNLQARRMEYMLLNCRSSLLSSNACMPVAQLTNDAFLSAVINPGSGSCSIQGITNYCIGGTIKPIIEIKNMGMANLNTLQIHIQIDGAEVSTYNWTGNLATNEKAIVNLPAIAANTEGKHTIKIYVAAPNGLTDERNTNDTLSSNFKVAGIHPLTAIEEGFNSPLFPPANWDVINRDNDLTWQYNSEVGKKQKGSAWFNDYNNATNNRVDDLITPTFSYSNIDSVFLHFQVANAMFSSAYSFGTPVDTLSVLLSKDCGNTYSTIYKKWGKDLETVDESWIRDNEFFPRSVLDWRRDSVNLGKFLGTSENSFQLAFRFSGNYENNIYLDDINIYTKILPLRLKQNGFLILPTVTQSVFAIWHYQQPVTLHQVIVYNASGQLVWGREYNGNADKFIPVNLSGKSAGIYIVQLNYTDASQNVTQRIVKY